MCTQYINKQCNILTWNVRGIMSSAGTLSDILDKQNIDIAIITEHKLKVTHKEFLNSIHSNYASISKCDDSVDPQSRCGKGGVAILYRSELAFQIRPIDGIQNIRITGLELTRKNCLPVFLLAVYMPSINYCNDDYMCCIDALQSLMDMYSHIGTVIVSGDLNVSLCKTHNDIRSNPLRQFIDYNNLTEVQNTGCQFTFRPTRKKLDYLLIGRSKTDLIETHLVFDDDSCCVSDHLPMFTALKLPIETYHIESHSHVAWHKCTDQYVNQYQETVKHELSKLNISNYQNQMYIPSEYDIELLYNHIVNSIKLSAENVLPKSKYNKHTKPYWTSEVKAAHTKQRLLRRQWINAGRPRGNDNEYYANYKRAKRLFTNIQKQAIENCLSKYFDELNIAADCDMRLFWSLVNKKKKKKSGLITELLNKDIVEREPNAITECMKTHFANVFIPKTSPNFDNAFKLMVDDTILDFKLNYSENVNVQSNDLSGPVDLGDLYNMVKSLKRRKAPSHDGIVNEHILYGGETLIAYLKTLYDMMYSLSYTPSDCKLGVIIPVFKDGKVRNQPSSYRPITLLPVIYKLFEKITHKRLQNFVGQKNIMFPDPQQNAYQTYLGPISVSFNLQETIAHNIEHGSKVFVFLMDTSGAFDNVWHNGLFFKLLKMGIESKLIQTIINSYSDMSSCVMVNGILSDKFPVLQGVRQGGILSTWLYLLYIDELLNTLQNTNYGCTIGSLNCGNPTLADDLSLVSPNTRSLEEQVLIAERYASQWRYEFNRTKCKLFVLGDKKNTPYTIKFGSTHVDSVPLVTHVGIDLHNSFKSSYTIKSRCRKGNASLFSVLSIESKPGDINPLVLADLIQKVTIPVLLYGCELWHALSLSDTITLERVIRLAAKCIQKVPKTTRTDMAIAMLGWRPLMCYIDKRKFGLLQKLCTMPTNLLSRKIFNLRLNLFMLKGLKSQIGFIPDVITIVKKYNLTQYISNYLKNAVFPSKYEWKRIISKSLNSYYDNARHARVIADPEFDRFNSVHNSTSQLYIWKCAESADEIVSAFSAIKLLVSVDQLSNREQTCKCCEQITIDIKRHLLTECQAFKQMKIDFLSSINIRFGTPMYELLQQADSEHFVRYILSVNSLNLLHMDEILNVLFIRMSTSYIHTVFQMYDGM